MADGTDRPDDPHYVSTGTLPAPEGVALLVAEAHRRYRDNTDGDVSRVYPALARMPPDLFGICVGGVSGRIWTAGDADAEFTIMSVSKPFVFALICQELGPDETRQRIGVNATGLPFNSPEAIERSPDGRTNPMVNPGAIATTSLTPGATLDGRWHLLHDGLNRFAGRNLSLDSEVYASAMDTNVRNRELADMLAERGRLAGNAGDALDLYTRQCSLTVCAKDLATMAATLADGGVNPITRERVIEPEVCEHVLAVMATAGLYETSGDWLYDLGLPGKSGIGGGIIATSPGKGGLGVFAPRLDAAGNSVKGKLAARFLSRALGLNLFASNPADSRP